MNQPAENANSELPLAFLSFVCDVSLCLVNIPW